MAEDEVMPSPLASKIANNEIMTAVARVAMVLSLPILTVGGTMTTNWLESKFNLQEAKVENMRISITGETANALQRISTLELQFSQLQRMNERIVQLETRQVQDAKAFESFQLGTSAKLDRIQESVTSMTSSIATLTAVLQTVSESNRRREQNQSTSQPRN